jgi:hypothetical protein
VNQKTFRPGIEPLEDRTLLSTGVLHPTPFRVHPQRRFGFNPVAQVQHALTSLTQQATQVAHTLQHQTTQTSSQISHQGTLITNQLRQASNTARQRALNFGNQIRHQANSLFNSVANHKVVAFDFTTHGSITANFRTGSYYGSLDLGAGASFDTNDLDSLLADQIPIPQFDPIQTATTAVGLHTVITSGYNATRASYLNSTGTTYFSSERFVNWASPRTLGTYIAAIVASGGSATSSVIKDAEGQLMLELNDIVSWLENVGVSSVESAAGSLLGGMFKALFGGSGSTMMVGSQPISFAVVNVPVTYSVQAGSSMLPNISSLVGKSNGSLFTGTEPHLGFAITLGYGYYNTDPYGYALSSFDQTKLTDTNLLAQAFPAILQAALGQSSDSRVTKALKALNYSEYAATYAQSSLRDRLFGALHLSGSDLAKIYQPGNPIIDLTHTHVADGLLSLLLPLALGNEHSASVDQMQFNLETDTLSIKVSLHHRHSWGSAGDLLKAVNNFVHQKTGSLVQASKTEGQQLGRQAKALSHGVVTFTRTQLHALLNTIHQLRVRFLFDAHRGISPTQVVQQAQQTGQAIINTTKTVVDAGLQAAGNQANNLKQQGGDAVKAISSFL